MLTVEWQGPAGPTMLCRRMGAVVFDAVSKHFDAKVALGGVTFSVPEAKVTGLLGPNGSGKTTALRLMLNLFRPDSGCIRVFGAHPSAHATDRVGYLPEERGLYRKMKVMEVLRYYARLKGRRPRPQALRRWLEMLHIDEFRGHRIQDLSKGTAQKVQFITAVVHEPQLLILDEPFSGLDPLSREHLKGALEFVLTKGVSVILSTHDMTLAQNLCDHFLMLSAGRKVLDKNRRDLSSEFGGFTVKVEADSPLKHLEQIQGVSKAMDFGNYHELILHQGSDTNAILQALAQRAQIRRFELSQPSLHDIFLRLAKQ